MYSFFGQRCRVRNRYRIEAVHRSPQGWVAMLTLGGRIGVEHDDQVVCQANVTVDADVSITACCAIGDTVHPHDPLALLSKTGHQVPRGKAAVHIGAGKIVGVDDVIPSPVRIERGYVTGGGAVIKSDVSDYSVAVGAPARAGSTFNAASQQRVCRAALQSRRLERRC